MDVGAILEELLINGVVEVADYIDPEYAQRVADESYRVMEQCLVDPPQPVGIFDKRFGLDANLVNQGITRFYHIEHRVPAVTQFIEDPLVRFVCEAYYRRKLRVETTIFQHNVVCEKGTRDWHIDSWVNQIKPFLYLTDVGPGNGPFTYLLKSHENNDFLLRKAFRCMNGLETTDVSDEVVKSLGLQAREFFGPRGTLLIADTKGIHQGGTMTQGVRSAISTYMYYA
jgi:hypothetical protein